MAASTLINAIRLPPQLGRLLPSAMPVSVTILDNAALGRARTIVRLTDDLSRILLSADVAVALTGLAAARRRRRALLGIAIPVAARGILGALGVRVLTRTGGSPLVTAVTDALTAPLASQLLLTSAICAALVALVLTVPWFLPHAEDRDFQLHRSSTAYVQGAPSSTPRQEETGSARWPD
jgi:hypothetical protein